MIDFLYFTGTWKIKIFVWLSFVLDFFGIFFIVSFAFYQPTNTEYQQYFDNFFDFCFWEMVFCVFPFAVIGSIGLHIYWDAKVLVDKFIRYRTYPYACYPFALLAVTLFWVIGLFLTLLIMNIFCVLWPAFAILGMSTSSRLPFDKEPKQFYLSFIPWIKDEATAIRDIDNNKVLFTANEDRIRRLCVLNKIVLEQHEQGGQYDYSAPWQNYLDQGLLSYLKEKEKKQFQGVTYTDLRVNCQRDAFEYSTKWRNRRRQPYLLEYFFYEVYATMLMEFKHKRTTINYHRTRCYTDFGIGVLYWLTFIAGPIYLLSRTFNVFLPLSIVLYLGGEGINLFTDLDVFQVVMLSSYASLLAVWFILGCFVLRDLFILWHILPSCGYLKAAKLKDGNDEVTKMIKDAYFEMTAYPQISLILTNQFGPDISFIILDYFKSIKSNDTLQVENK